MSLMCVILCYLLLVAADGQQQLGGQDDSDSNPTHLFSRLPPGPPSFPQEAGFEKTRTGRSAGKGCHGKADIVFLLDKSGSVGQGNFDKMLEFVKDVTSKFDIGPNDVQIGVDTFSSSFNHEFTLNRFSSENSISRAVDSIAYTGGGTNTAGALDAMAAQSFTPSTGHRTGVPKIAVVVTDGNSNDRTATATAAQTARNVGIHVLAVGVGTGVDDSELNAIASDPDSQNVFRAANFNVLQSLGKLIAAETCKSVKPTPQPQLCTKADIVFLLDSSGSVGSSNFRKMLSFVNSLVNGWNIGLNNVRVGVAKFSSSPTTEFDLNDYNNKQQVLSAISSINYGAGGTETGAALRHMKDNMFTGNNGDRAGVPNIGIIITDGKSNNPSQTKAQADLVRRAGITIFSVGIGSGISMSELNDMATDPDADHVFTVGDYSKLAQVKTLFQKQTCGDSSSTCVDHITNCPAYRAKTKDLCQRYKPWSLINCRRFCNFCGE